MQVDCAVFKFFETDLYYLALTKEEMCIVSNVMLFKQ